MPALRKEAWYPYMEENDLFQDFKGNIILCKYYRYTPVFSHVLHTGDICIIPPHTKHSVWVFDDSIAVNILVRGSTFQSAFFQTLTADSSLA